MPQHEEEIEGSVETWVASVESLIASAVFIAARNRFDAPDVVHLIRASKGQIDWPHILKMLGDNWELLFWMLTMFDYIYPGHSDYLPQDLMVEMFENIKQRWKTNSEHSKEFRGSILDPFSYTVDLEDWGYSDRRRLEPLVDNEGDLL